VSKTRADETNNFYLIIARRLALTLTNTHQLVVGALIVAKEVKHMGKKRNQEASTNKSNRAAQQTQIVNPKPDQQETLHQIRRA